MSFADTVDSHNNLPLESDIVTTYLTASGTDCQVAVFVASLKDISMPAMLTCPCTGAIFL